MSVSADEQRGHADISNAADYMAPFTHYFLRLHFLWHHRAAERRSFLATKSRH